jgi:hypothetical protein
MRVYNIKTYAKVPIFAARIIGILMLPQDCTRAGGFMKIDVLQLLATQRDLYAMPRGMDRFRAYIAAMTGGTDDLALPLVSMNPMGKEHIAAMIDNLLNMDAESIARAAAAEASERLPNIPGQISLGLVATDDGQGGWTNRYFTEMALRFETAQLLRRGWAVVPLWTSEPWSPDCIREEVRASVYRSAFQQQHSQPHTLAAMMIQEGWTARFAGAAQPALEPDDLDYTRVVLEPHRAASDRPTVFACLYGDEAARSVGYPPLGLSARAGLALARVEALAQPATPEELLSACPKHDA